MSEEKSTIQILSEARNVIATDGWVRGEYHSSGKFCALGALEKAYSGEIATEDTDFLRSPILQEAITQLERTIVGGGRFAYADLAEYNDQLDNVGDILSLFDDTIESLEGK